MIKSNKIKKALFGTAIAGMTFAGGFGLGKHNAKTEKDQLKAKVETSFDAQIKLNNNQLTEIAAERDCLHQKAQEMIEIMIEEQNDTTEKQRLALIENIKYSFSRQEKFRILEELNTCFDGDKVYKDISSIGVEEIIAVTNDGFNDNTNLLSLEEYEMHKQTKFLYPELGAKRVKFALEYRELCKEFIYNYGDEKEFVYSMITYTNNIDAGFYSVIIDDIVNYYNLRKNTVFVWGYNRMLERSCTICRKDIVGGVPDFSLIAFKKYKSNIDTICKRLHELDKQEKQLQQARNLKNIIIADFSR